MRDGAAAKDAEGGMPRQGHLAEGGVQAALMADMRVHEQWRQLRHDVEGVEHPEGVGDRARVRSREAAVADAGATEGVRRHLVPAVPARGRPR